MFSYFGIYFCIEKCTELKMISFVTHLVSMLRQILPQCLLPPESHAAASPWWVWDPYVTNFAWFEVDTAERYSSNVRIESLCFKLNTELHSDGEKKGQIESLKQEISSLKEQIIQQQQELHTKTVQVREATVKRWLII